MIYPEDGRRIIRIRNNHQERRNSGRRKKAALFTFCGIVLAGCIAAGYYFEVPSKVMQAFKSMESVDGQTATIDNVTEETPEQAAVEKKEEIIKEVEEVPAETTIVFTGDIWLDPAVQKNYDASGVGGVVDDGLLASMTGADICTVNNEFAFSLQGQQADKQYTYRVDPKYVTILNDMGIDVAGLANNHALDFGTVALSDTFATLDGAAIKRIGAGNSLEEAKAPAVVEVNGQTYAFIAATHVIPEVSWNVINRQPGMLSFYDETELLDAIAAAKAEYDHVYVLAHWGKMRTTELTDYQVNDGHKFIDAGADAVIGAHPHVLQGIEYYNGGYVFYSLGDFISTNTIAQTMAVAFTVDGENTTVRLLPATCSNYRTVSADEGKTAEIYQMLKGISKTVSIADDGTLSQAGAATQTQATGTTGTGATTQTEATGTTGNGVQTQAQSEAAGTTGTGATTQTEAAGTTGSGVQTQTEAAGTMGSGVQTQAAGTAGSGVQTQSEAAGTTENGAETQSGNE